MADYRACFVEIRGNRLGFEYSRVRVAGSPYLDRYILYVGFGCVRLHKFWRGDDVRAPHDHPFDFWTFPFTDYMERVYMVDGRYRVRRVKAWRLHARPAEYRHIVLGVPGTNRPFWTLVFATRPRRTWGFWPRPGLFVKWWEWGT